MVSELDEETSLALAPTALDADLAALPQAATSSATATIPSAAKPRWRRRRESFFMESVPLV
jgi:hypothetical protein